MISGAYYGERRVTEPHQKTFSPLTRSIPTRAYRSRRLPEYPPFSSLGVPTLFFYGRFLCPQLPSFLWFYLLVTTILCGISSRFQSSTLAIKLDMGTATLVILIYSLHTHQPMFCHVEFREDCPSVEAAQRSSKTRTEFEAAVEVKLLTA